MIKYGKSNDVKKLIEKYLENYNTNKDLWEISLKLKIEQTNKSNQSELIDLFKKSLLAVKENVKIAIKFGLLIRFLI